MHAEPENQPATNAPDGDKPAPRKLAPAAQRALEEAAARRAEMEARVGAMPRELGGRGGEEPIRYGDWEVKGLATDF